MENLAYLHRRKSSGYWKVTRYPNGEFTIGKNQPSTKDKGDHPLDGIGSHTTFYGATKVSVPAREIYRESSPKNLERIALDFEKAGNQEMANYFSDRYADRLLNSPGPIANVELSKDITANNQDCYDDDWSDIAVSPLGLSDATNSHKSLPRKVKKSQKRGLSGVSSHGKRMIKNCGYLLERDHGRYTLSFLTATLPAFATESDLRLICGVWSELVRQFIQELRRILRRRKFCEDMVYITEIQEDRYRDRGEVAPHLHLVMVGKKHRYQKGYAIEKSEVRALWERLLSNFLGRPVTCVAATRVERPRKSLQGELGSYMSKGGKLIKEIINDGKGDFLPSAYWGASMNLRKMVKRETKISNGVDALKFIDNLSELHEAGLVYFKPIMWFCENIGRKITIGFVGWIRDIGVVSEFLKAA